MIIDFGDFKKIVEEIIISKNNKLNLDNGNYFNLSYLSLKEWIKYQKYLFKGGK